MTALVLLVGGAAAGTSPDTTAKPAPATRVAAETEPPAPAPQVAVHSETQTATQEVNAQFISVAQVLAAMTVYEQPPAPLTDASADESSSPLNSSGDEVPVSDPSPSTGPTGATGAIDEPTSEPIADDANGNGCSDSYDGACLTPYTGLDDVNCADVTETDFDSVADDPYRLDSDGDGIACESY